jgi:hypothetical protein
MSNKIYDILKWIALVVLPALGTLYFALAQIWGFPYGAEIVGTITAIDAFLGALLGISTTIYNKQEGLADLKKMQKEFEKQEEQNNE